LILFRLSSGSELEHTEIVNVKTDKAEADDSTSGILNPWNRQIYIMEASCPHLGADLSHADIEECETGVVAVCPWHRFAPC
jgi:nitrite reductase/ring-hydroxylating ferredoxin subunit